jgi:hypothetical protein
MDDGRHPIDKFEGICLHSARVGDLSHRLPWEMAALTVDLWLE